ncbi:hypothetical protein ACFVH4_13760 [Nocardia ignorata]|uniref:hypothetical protein n=1 Tax=Nocardia ignorata TaxID=145285 RepID=UPI0036308B43
MTQRRIKIPGDTPEERLRSVARSRAFDGKAPDERWRPPRPPSPDPGTAIEKARRETVRRLTEGTDTDA